MDTIIFVGGILVLLLAFVLVQRISDKVEQREQEAFKDVMGLKGFINTNLFCFVDKNQRPVRCIKNFICSNLVISRHELPKYIPCSISGVFPAEEKNDTGTLYVKPLNITNEEFKVVMMDSRKVLLVSEKYGEILIKCSKFKNQPMVGDVFSLSAKFRNIYGYPNMWRISWSVN